MHQKVPGNRIFINSMLYILIFSFVLTLFKMDKLKHTHTQKHAVKQNYINILKCNWLVCKKSKYLWVSDWNHPFPLLITPLSDWCLHTLGVWQREKVWMDSFFLPAGGVFHPESLSLHVAASLELFLCSFACTGSNTNGLRPLIGLSTGMLLSELLTQPPMQEEEPQTLATYWSQLPAGSAAPIDLLFKIRYLMEWIGFRSVELENGTPMMKRVQAVNDVNKLWTVGSFANERKQRCNWRIYFCIF